jgi:GTP-binding protein
MRFVDHVKVYVQAGKGGNGCVSFQSQRFRPKGGPDGGDAGRGGSVTLLSDPQIPSLLDLLYHPRLIAQDGQPGRRNRQSGRDGEDLVVRVPVGTLVIDSDTGSVLDDLDKGGKRIIVASGGKGGRGNTRFATSINRAPRQFGKGREGEKRWLKLELRLPNDVGLIGLPNTGKSLLISRISSTTPRIADYPFTTTSPHLGVFTDESYRRFTVADMPPLIENAHQGRGLGTAFLTHLERSELLIHVLDSTRFSDHEPLEDYGTVVRELTAFGSSLCKKTQIVAINKIDLLENLNTVMAAKRVFAERGIPAVAVSAMTGQGMDLLVAEVLQRLEELGAMTQGRATRGEQEPEEGPV